jgi:hypothetical protein
VTPRIATPYGMTDPAMWRSLLAAVHPDRHGSHELFVWCQRLREHVAGDSFAFEDVRTAYERRRPPPHPSASERLDFTAAFDLPGFDALTERAMRTGPEVGEPYASVLRLVADCYPVQDGPLFRQQHAGASYKSLAAIAYAAGLSRDERVRWYRICERIPLSQSHANHILRRLRGTWKAA